MQGKGKILSVVSEKSSRLDPSNWRWKNICVFGIKRICRRDRNWFARHSSKLLECLTTFPRAG